jgi:hypothetical protein
MPDAGENERLRAVYYWLREKLLDLTLTNRMLNHAMAASGRRQVRFVGFDLQHVYESLMVQGARISMAPLHEPDTIPLEERGGDFLDALCHAQSSDG